MNTALEGVGSHGHARVPNDVPRPPFDQSANELLDGHFRLLRHDMLGSAFEQLHERNVSRRRRNKVHDTLYKVQALQPNPKYGAEISFSFQLHNEHPVFHLSQRQAKEDALDRSAIFKRDALLMLMRDKKAVHIARVAKTDKANLAKGEINLTFPDQSSLVTILGELTDVKAHAKKGGRLNAVNGKDAESGAGSGFTAIAIAASFFSYEPVLRRLQTMHTLQFDTEFVQSKVLERTMPDTTYWPSGGEYRDRYIQEYARNKGLNESQANALSRGARKRVALIQGPPGTGKTYVGAALAEMILLRGKQKILLCCYTNHALDQFLEALLPVTQQIVRIGGSCKSAIMEPYCLNRLTKDKAVWSKPQTRRYHQLKDERAQLERECERLGQQVARTMGEKWWDTIGDYLKTHRPDQFAALQKPGSVGAAARGEYDEDELSGSGNGGYRLPTLDDSVWQVWYKGSDAPPKMKAHKGHELWKMHKAARRKRVETWTHEINAPKRVELAAHLRKISAIVAEIDQLRWLDDQRVLEGADVIGCTTWGAAKYASLLQQQNIDVVIAEEAGEILEAHILTALPTTCKQLILIGDHKQLRPKVEFYPLDKASRQGYNLNVSLFERLALSGRVNVTMLKEQHRMQPAISALVRTMTYPELRDHSSVQGRQPVKGLRSSVVFVNMQGCEGGESNAGGSTASAAGAALVNGGALAASAPEARSKTNAEEADMAVAAVCYLLQQGYKPSEVVVLTPYLGQLVILRTRLGKALLKLAASQGCVSVAMDQRDVMQAQREGCELDSSVRHVDAERSWTSEAVAAAPSEDSPDDGVRVATVDNFQGEEARIIVASLVRCNDHGNIGFLKEPERVNVLLSRARDGLIILGNMNTLLANKQQTFWRQLLEGMDVYDGLPLRCVNHGQVATPRSGKELTKLCPSGGCALPCEMSLDCGHKCPLKCHPCAVTVHAQFRCSEKVMWQCEHGGHSHVKECWLPVPKTCKQCAAQEKAKKQVEDAKKELDAARSKAVADRELLAHQHEAKMLQERAKKERDNSALRAAEAKLKQVYESERTKLETKALKRQDELRAKQAKLEEKQRKALEDDAKKARLEQQQLEKKAAELALERHVTKIRLGADLQTATERCGGCHKEVSAVLGARCQPIDHFVCQACLDSAVRQACSASSSVASGAEGGPPGVPCPVERCLGIIELSDALVIVSKPVGILALEHLHKAGSISAVPSHWGNSTDLLIAGDVTFRRTVEDYITRLAVPRSHGHGRDSHGQPFRGFGVIRVERVQNRTVWCRYSAERKIVTTELRTEHYRLPREVERLLPPSPPLQGIELEAGERLLFHGSSKCKEICQTGFEVKHSFNGAAAYGRGIYFAASPSKSDQYAGGAGGEAQMLICRTLLGRIGVVNASRPNETLLPLVPGRNDGMRLNSIVATGHFQEIVLDANNQVYPELLVTYIRR